MGSARWTTTPSVLGKDQATAQQILTGAGLKGRVAADGKFDETLDLCDRTSPYGLTGAVFATDRQAIGKASERLVNAAGNFYYSGTVALPYRAKVVRGTSERIMPIAQTSGDCNGCHTQNGANGAPGRIMLP